MLPAFLKTFIGRLFVLAAVPISWRIAVIGLSIVSMVAAGTSGNSSFRLPDWKIFQSFPFMSQPAQTVTRSLSNQAMSSVPSIRAQKLSLSYKQRLVSRMNVPIMVSKHSVKEKVLIGGESRNLKEMNTTAKMRYKSQVFQETKKTDSSEVLNLDSGWAFPSKVNGRENVPISRREIRRYYSKSKSPTLVRYVNRNKTWKQVYAPGKIHRKKQIQDSITFIKPMPAKPVIE